MNYKHVVFGSVKVMVTLENDIAGFCAPCGQEMSLQKTKSLFVKCLNLKKFEVDDKSAPFKREL